SRNSFRNAGQSLDCARPEEPFRSLEECTQLVISSIKQSINAANEASGSSFLNTFVLALAVINVPRERGKTTGVYERDRKTGKEFPVLRSAPFSVWVLSSRASV